MDLGLRGRVIVVTGGSSGIGLAVVEALLAEGAFVATCGRNRMRLDAAAMTLLQSGALLAMPADVTDVGAMGELVAHTVERFGRIDGVAAIAGQGIHGRALELSFGDWQAEILNKLAGVLNIASAARVHLARSDAARIVTLTAPSGRDPDHEMAAVSAARAALANLTRSLALELAGDGIAVNAVAVGLIDTERQRVRHRERNIDQSYEAWLAAEARRRFVPFLRAGKPEEVARLCVFALSPALSYTTGAILDATGGVPGP